MKKFLKKFTLLELVIVLAIVAALATMLLDNVADLKLRELEDKNIQQGMLVKDFMTGKNSKSQYSSFVSDMGRYPKVTQEGLDDNGRLLAQLYDKTIFYHGGNDVNDDTMFNHLQEIEITTEVLDLNSAVFDNSFEPYLPIARMNVGWNGPYLNLFNSDRASFVDAWGNPWRIVRNWHLDEDPSNTGRIEEVYDDLDATLELDDEIDGIVSYGANDVEDLNEGEVQFADKDSRFIFAHEDNLATLNVIIKVRDTLNPSNWVNLKVGTEEEYKNVNSYSKGDVVKYNNKYYTCLADNTTTAPTTTTVEDGVENTEINAQWQRGTPANFVAIDSSKILIFSPMLNKKGENEFMELGLYCISPKDEFVPLRNSDDTKYDLDLFPEFSNIGSFDDINDKHLMRSWVEVFWDADEVEKTIDSAVRVERLLPGRKLIFGFFTFNDGANYGGSYSVSNVEILDLVKGENTITLYLERKI